MSEKNVSDSNKYNILEKIGIKQWQSKFNSFFISFSIFFVGFMMLIIYGIFGNDELILLLMGISILLMSIIFLLQDILRILYKIASKYLAEKENDTN